MGISTKNKKIIFDSSFEEEIISLCEQYPNLRVYIGHNRRAANAALYFFEALPVELRKKYNKIGTTKWEILFSNGSAIRFINFNLGVSTLIPEPPIHIFLSYGIKNQVIIRNMCMSMVPYDGEVAKEHRDLFPLFNDKPAFNVNGFIFAGTKFWEEYERIEDKVKQVKEDSTSTVYYKPDAGYKPDISAYDKAQELFENEQDEILILRQELEKQKDIRKALEKRLSQK